MDVLSIERLKQIRDKQQETLDAMIAAGEEKHRIDDMKFAIKCTDRRIERAQAADYDENIRNIQLLGQCEEC